VRKFKVSKRATYVLDYGLSCKWGLTDRWSCTQASYKDFVAVWHWRPLSQ